MLFFIAQIIVDYISSFYNSRHNIFHEHFKTPGHSFEDDAEFIIIEKLENFEETTEKLKEKLKQRENFWIKELKTLKPHGLNMELNNV